MTDVILLSKKQANLLRKVAEGGRIVDVARELGMNPGTVQNHMNKVYRKMGVNSKAEALALVDRVREFDGRKEQIIDGGVRVLPCHLCKYEDDCRRDVFRAEFTPFCFPLDLDGAPNWRHQQYRKEYGQDV